jgi:hypothetical protein
MRRACAILLACLLLSGHAAGLQLLAWASMFAARVGTAPSISAALVSTVDGSDPCALCHAAADLAVDQDPATKPDPAGKLGKKPDGGQVRVVELPANLVVRAGHSWPQAMAEPLSHIPDIEPPPPRS